jgi:hypothetical protein
VAARRRALAATPADRYPRAAATAATMADYISTQQYRVNLVKGQLRAQDDGVRS